VRGEPHGTSVRLWVEDQGIGIDPRHHDRIFQVFERLHGDTYPGTGMGLAIVRKVAARLGGAAGVESEPGRGSRFWINLPIASATATEKATTDAAPAFEPAEDEPAQASH
jgi:signal transduction histidine kinase